jgi:hypothetical protein
MKRRTIVRTIMRGKMQRTRGKIFARSEETSLTVRLPECK